ncbi:RNA polymerase sigma factor [Singulisphaera sp. PoT]|uniref:RNA polymerase sigma factor n=1 Tax=Singulisphaera sp. PoT TaxID=3411797 RepID=UPI003BF5405A
MADVPTTRASLLVRLKSPRDERAWAEFVEIYEPLIHRLARAKGVQKADADDLAQDVFRAVAGAIERWDIDPARGSFRAWLSRIARNLIVNLLAAHGRQTASFGKGGTEMLELLEALPGVDADAAEFDLEYRRQVFAVASQRVREHFQETTWEAFWRAGVENRDVAEVAVELGLTPGALYVARSRVIARLRQEIERIRGDEDAEDS